MSEASLAGALCEEFRRVRRALAGVYGVDESVSLEMALWGGVDEDCEVDEGRVDEISFGKLVRATGKSYARNASGLPSDQLLVYYSLHNKYKNDPEYNKEIRDVKDRSKVNSFKARFNAAQKTHREIISNADSATKKDHRQRLLRMNNATKVAQASADSWAKSHPNAIRFHLNGKAELKGIENKADLDAETRKYLGRFSSCDASDLR